MRKVASTVIVIALGCSRSELDSPTATASSQTQSTCFAPVAEMCRGLRLLTKDAPFSALVPNATLIARNGGYEWPNVQVVQTPQVVQTLQMSRLVLTGSPPVLVDAPPIPIDTTGMDGFFAETATDGARLFACTRGHHNQLWIYDATNALTSMLSFSEAADNPCSVSAFGNMALVTYDVFDSDGERAVLTNDQGFVFSKDRDANPYTTTYSCGFLDTGGTFGGGGYNFSRVWINALPMDGQERASFDIPLEEPGEPTFARWPYDSRSFAMVWRAHSGDLASTMPDGECDVHLIVANDKGITTVNRTYASICAVPLGVEGRWLPHVLVAGFGAVLDSGDGQLHLLAPDGSFVGESVVLPLLQPSSPTDDVLNTLWSVADEEHVIAILQKGSQSVQSVIGCDE